MRSSIKKKIAAKKIQAINPELHIKILRLLPSAFMQKCAIATREEVGNSQDHEISMHISRQPFQYVA